MKKIAICGNIASGKSTVSKYIENKGFKVLDTDKVSHELLTVNNKKLYDAFKDFDVFECNEFSRKKVANLIFKDNSKKTELEKILHPQIASKIKNFLKKNSEEKSTFVEIPLLFEAKMENLFDKIIFVYADDKTRLERLIKRNGYTVEEAKTRINSQIPQDEKVKKSDYVIYNNSSVKSLEEETEKILSLISFA